MIEMLPQYITLNEDRFCEFLEGQTHPAKFKINGGIWVVRYIKNLQKYPRHNLRLASEFVGYRISQKLGVPAPESKIVRVGESFKKRYFGHQKNEEIEVRAGLATASKWLENALCPDIEKGRLDKFWEEDYYLEIVAHVRTADTWIMNFDRRKRGNVLLTGPLQSPHVWFLDFDQSFLAKEKCPIHGFRLHWSEEAFRREWLDDTEVLSGFDGTGDIRCESVQRFVHFKNVLVKLKNINDEELKEVLEEIPFEWNISKKARQQWLENFLHRRDVTIRNIENRYPR